MKKLLNNILNWIKSFLFGFKKFYREHGQQVIEIVGKIKEAVESENADAIVNLTKSNWDNRILYALRRVFENIYLGVAIPKSSQPGVFGVIEDLIEYLKLLKSAAPDMKAAIYLKIGALLLKEFLEENISDSDADTLVQVSFKMNKEGKL